MGEELDIERELENVYRESTTLVADLQRLLRESDNVDPELAHALGKLMDTRIRALDRLMALRYKMKPQDVTREIERAIEEIISRAEEAEIPG